MILYRLAVRRHDYHVDFNIPCERLLTESEGNTLIERFRKKFEELNPDILGTEMVLTVKNAEYEPTGLELAQIESLPTTLDFIK